MAKKHKLTIEEKLQQALVPKEEQPYEIPDNWCWTYLKNIATWGSGGTPSRRKKEYYTGDIPWVKTGELNNDYITDTEEKITVEAIKHSNAKLYPINTVIIAMYGATIGKVGILSVPACTNQACACAKLFSEVLYKYLFYYLVFQKEAFINKAKGGAQPNLSQELIKCHVFPISSMAEQQRIVDKIENLFAKLDKAKDFIQATIDKFEQNKMAVLHKAFTGELTATWREKNNLDLNSWKKVYLKDICEKITCGKTPTGYISDKDEIPYLKVYNIVDDQIAFTNKKQFIPKTIHENKLKSSILKPNDVIMNIVGPPLRKVAIIPNDYPEWNINQAIVRFRAKEQVLYKFLYYILIYPKTLDNIINDTKGVVGQVNISVTQARNLEINLPTIEEQQHIVAILDNLFAKYNKLQSLEKQLVQIELLKKSILAKAFRGGLGMNDGDDESAMELLKSILANEE